MTECLEKVFSLNEELNKTALITGASGGIGLEFAKILAYHKYNLVLISRTKTKLDDLKSYLVATYGVQVFVIVCDLSKPGACRYIYEQLIKNGLDIDVLINNAGIGDWGPFIDSSIQKQEDMLQLNVLGLTNLTRLLLPGMVKRGQGKVLNVASTAAFQPGPLMAVYFASKAYVLSFSLGVAQELKGSGVSVTCLCPGQTATGFQQSTFFKEIRFMKTIKLANPRVVAECGYQAMLQGKLVAVEGFLNRVMAISVRFLPQWFVLRAVEFQQEVR